MQRNNALLNAGAIALTGRDITEFECEEMGLTGKTTGGAPVVKTVIPE